MLFRSIKGALAALCVIGGLATAANATTIAHWTFNEGTPGDIASGANSVLDISGNGHHGTPTGTPTYTVWGGNNGLSFDPFPAGDFVNISDHADFELTGSLTLEAAVRYTGAPTGFQMIMFRGDDRASLDPYYLALSEGRPFFHIENDINGPVNLLANDSIAIGQIVNIAATLDDATGDMKIFVDGVEVASTNTSVRPFGPLDPLEDARIGLGDLSANGGLNFTGDLFEARISDVALTTGEQLSVEVPAPAGMATLLLGLALLPGLRRRIRPTV